MSDAKISCATCAHWADKPADDWAAPYGSRLCKRVGELWEASRDSGRDYDDEGKTHLELVNPADLAWVCDGSSYRADLITMPTFFCAHHAIPEVTHD